MTDSPGSDHKTRLASTAWLVALDVVAGELYRSADLESLFCAIVEGLRCVVAHDTVSIAFIEPDGTTVLRVSRVEGALTYDRIPLAMTGAIDEAVRTGRPTWSSDLSAKSDATSETLAKHGILSSIVVPATAGGRIFATINVGSCEKNGFDATAAAPLMQLAASLAPAIEATYLRRVEREAIDLKERLAHADRLASMGQLAASVAHEINNPAAFALTNVVLVREQLASLGEATAESATGEVLREAMLMAEEAAEGIRRIGKIVAGLKSYGRAAHVDQEPLWVDDVVADAAKMLANDLHHRATLSLVLGKPPRVRGDAQKLVQVVTNLLSNAVEAVQAPGVSARNITIETGVVEGKVSVSVSDTGCGVPPELRARVFDAFFTTKREHGTGLGLALVAEIVQAHGGLLRMASEVGRGTTFEVLLPIAVDGILHVEAKRVSLRPTSARKSRVLLVDDQEEILRSFARVLRRHFEVETVCGGAPAIELLAKDALFDVVVCDLMMPTVSGRDVYLAVEELAPALCDRFVFCTGGAFTPLMREFAASRTNATLAKPIEPSLLVEAVAKVAVGKAAATED